MIQDEGRAAGEVEAVEEAGPAPGTGDREGAGGGPSPGVRPWARERAAWLAAALPTLAVLAWWAWPRAIGWATTVSTDDAYVDGHVTLVAPRVPGQVARVLVDDNDRVRKGDLLVELDREPYQARADLERSRVQAAEADLRAAESQVRGMLATARAQRWELQSAIEGVDNRVAELRSLTAALRSREATRDLARVEFARTEELLRRNAASRSDFDAATAGLRVAEAQASQAAEQVREARVGLGLPAEAPEGRGPDEVPEGLNQTFSGVRRALADQIRTMAQLGLPLRRARRGAARRRARRPGGRAHRGPGLGLVRLAGGGRALGPGGGLARRVRRPRPPAGRRVRPPRPAPGPAVPRLHAAGGGVHGRLPRLAEHDLEDGHRADGLRVGERGGDGRAVGARPARPGAGAGRGGRRRGGAIDPGGRARRPLGRGALALVRQPPRVTGGRSSGRGRRSWSA